MLHLDHLSINIIQFDIYKCRALEKLFNGDDQVKIIYDKSICSMKIKNDKNVKKIAKIHIDQINIKH